MGVSILYSHNFYLSYCVAFIPPIYPIVHAIILAAAFLSGKAKDKKRDVCHLLWLITVLYTYFECICIGIIHKGRYFLCILCTRFRCIWPGDIMLRYKIDIMQTLKGIGYTACKPRKDKVIGEAQMQKYVIGRLQAGDMKHHLPTARLSARRHFGVCA